MAAQEKMGFALVALAAAWVQGAAAWASGAAARAPGAAACAPFASRTCPRMCEPPLSLEDLEDHWRMVRKQLIADGGVVPQPASPKGGDVDGGWVHRIAAPERGCLLVAQPDVYFKDNSLLHKSVLLLLEHDDELGGSLAIMLNRPTDNALADVLMQDTLIRAFGSQPLHLGGTSTESGTSNVFMLCETQGADRSSHKAFTGDEEASLLLPGLWLASAPEAAERVLGGAAPPSAFHFFAGAHVWKPGQLAKEFKAGAWSALSASTPTISQFLL